MSFDFSTTLSDFLLILFSILIEGIPFILIGGILSALVEKYISESKIKKLLPKNKILKLSSMGIMGNLTPVCECGNIPLARRMVKKGIEPAFITTFLLAAPAFNPIVIVSTIAAFPNDFSITFFRVLFTFIIAFSIGLLFSLFKKEELLIKKLLSKKGKKDKDHHHEHSFFQIIQKEFIEMTGIFIFGATIASLIQVFAPKELVFQFNQEVWISIIAMMTLAFVVSICSNVDSFFALAYSQIFPKSSIIAFLVLGPMIDIKAIPMLKTIFNYKTVIIIISLVGLMTFLLSYLHFLLT